MNEKIIIEKTKQFVKKTLQSDATGHDWFHIERVLHIALYIAKKEKQVNLLTVQLGALLHDIADWKFHNGNSTIGPKITREWLTSLSIDKKIIDEVCFIVEYISYKAGTNKKMQTKEGMIVQDADRLDALGAIGIARAFAYGGYKNREIYNPSIKINTQHNAKKYLRANGTTINHFYEKLLLLKDLMNTKPAKKIAEKREKFMKQFLNEFYKEWGSKKVLPL